MVTTTSILRNTFDQGSTKRDFTAPGRARVRFAGGWFHTNNDIKIATCDIYFCDVKGTKIRLTLHHLTDDELTEQSRSVMEIVSAMPDFVDDHEIAEVERKIEFTTNFFVIRTHQLSANWTTDSTGPKP